MVDGLLPNDFSVFEDGKKQDLKFFTSDPFPLVGGNHPGYRDA